MSAEMDGPLLTAELQIDGAPAGAFWVMAFEAREALSHPTWWSAQAATGHRLDVSALVGREAHLTVHRADGSVRRFHGVVWDVALEAPRADAFRVHVQVASRVALLTLGRDARIFQEKSVVDVAKAVLDRAGLRGDAQSWRTTGRYEPLANITQYQESDHDFVARILAEEGIGYAVRQGESTDQVAFVDGPEGWVAVDGVEALHGREGTQLSTDVVWDLRDQRATSSDAVMLRDYDLTRPSLDLSAREQADGSRGLEVYAHPGNFTDAARGRRLARRLLERLRLGRRVIQGHSDCPHLEPGRTVRLEGTGRAALDRAVVLVSVVHRGFVPSAEQGGTSLYENEFVALPDDAPYRPTPAAAPVVGGTSVAFVTGAPGEEIHTDAHGRARVRFPWDRSGITDDRASTWLRVGQLALGGSMILPRRDFEVVVDYEFGDIDRPMISGHVYNGQARPPYALPGAATRTSIQTATTGGGPGANELRFEDSAGSEEIFVNASKDMTVSTENDARWDVVSNVSRSIGATRTERVGADAATQVTGALSLSVGGNQDVNATARCAETVKGAETVSIGGSRTMTVGGDLTENTAAAFSRSVGGMQNLTGIKGYQRIVAGSATVSVGAASMVNAAGSIGLSCGGARSETIGGAKVVKAKAMSVSAKAAIATTCAFIGDKADGGRVDEATGAVALTAASAITVKANGVNVTASSGVTILAGGCVIKLAASGTVTIKAAKVDLTGAKQVGQAMHTSN